MQRYMIEGDPLFPGASDVIVETRSLPVGDPVPDGWRVLSGNNLYSRIARVVLRYEIGTDCN